MIMTLLKWIAFGVLSIILAVVAALLLITIIAMADAVIDFAQYIINSRRAERATNNDDSDQQHVSNKIRRKGGTK